MVSSTSSPSHGSATAWSGLMPRHPARSDAWVPRLVIGAARLDTVGELAETMARQGTVKALAKPLDKR